MFFRLIRLPDFLAIGTFLLLALFPWNLVLDSSLSLTNALVGPSLQHPLGTDVMGRDILVRLHQAMQDAILPLWLLATLATLEGIILGMALCLIPKAAWKVILLGTLTAISSIPVTLSIFAFTVLFEATGFPALGIGLGFLLSIRSCLQVVNLYTTDHKLGYWDAHEALGGSPLHRMIKLGITNHWRDNLLTMWAFHLQITILTEATLSYIGFGIPEPGASLGNIMASHFDLILKGESRVILPTLLALIAVVHTPKVLSRILPRLAST